ncbi:MAG: hypothetical protein E5W56_02650 [Mesorhizobium sp.]|nr:MAG: hypothetical protein E5W56_02650 [Mesorhizobium sp.]
MAALISISRSAESVSLLADHATVSLTKMSPLPGVAPLALSMVMLVLASRLESAAPVMSPPVAAMV